MAGTSKVAEPASGLSLGETGAGAGGLIAAVWNDFFQGILTIVMSLLIIPFVLVPIVSCLLLGPAVFVGVLIGGRDDAGRMTSTATVTGTLVACVLSAAAFKVGPRVSTYLAARRGNRVRVLLADPAGPAHSA